MAWNTERRRRKHTEKERKKAFKFHNNAQKQKQKNYDTIKKDKRKMQFSQSIIMALLSNAVPRALYPKIKQ